MRRFRPPFCPRRHCPDHRQAAPDYRAPICGSYRTRDGRTHPRYKCPTCRSSFSRRAFSPTYYLKRPELFRPTAAGLVAGSAHRQIARSLGCAPSTITRLSYRLGRHCLLRLLALQSELPDPIDESVVLDHFETFEFSQDLPFGVGTAVGERSWFIYGLEPAPHRRSGRVSPAQRRRLARRRPRPRYGGYAGSIGRILDRLTGAGPTHSSLRLVTDEHPSYGPAIDDHPAAGAIDHRIYRNPVRGPKGSARSKQARIRDRAMFPVDLLHGLIRHSQAAHRRETIAFGRRLDALMLRMYLLAIWRNLIKPRSERRPGRGTPAMALGLTARPWRWREVLDRRRFPDRIDMPQFDQKLYRMQLHNPELPSNTQHELRLAY